MKRAIEESFPIVEINRLAVPERNAFKPIYTMHKWFARRASCVFRSILIGSLKPAGTDLMAEFYKDHGDDPDTKGKVILDPFMGGGTTVVEALRLGCKVVAADLSPVAWFVVKTQVEPIDLTLLDAAFSRLASRRVDWSGKTLRDTLLDLYRTEAPWILPQDHTSSLPESDVIYTFWVKSAPCTSPICRKPVTLFGDFVVATKSPTVRYHPDCTCPRCHEQFDWEIEPAALVADPRLMVHAATYSAGEGRANTRWTYAHPDGGIFVAQGVPVDGQATVKWGTVPAGYVSCPHCAELVKPQVGTGTASAGGKGHKPKRKKVPLTVLLCPQTEEVFQWRGKLTAESRVCSPGGHSFAPYISNMSEKGRFVCPHCGNNDAVIEAIRSLPVEERLPLSAYAVQAYASGCDPQFLRDEGHDEDSLTLGLTNLPSTEMEVTNSDDDEDDDENQTVEVKRPAVTVPRTHNLVWLQKGKYYARHSPKDLARYQDAARIWSENVEKLPHPLSRIPEEGQETDRLHEHHYHKWSDMFLPRQLLGLATLLQAISEEADISCQEMLLSAFFSLIEGSNGFARYKANQQKSESAKGLFSRHDYAPKMTPCEDNIWGTNYGKGFVPWFEIVKKGKAWAKNSENSSYDPKGSLVRIFGAGSCEFSSISNQTLGAGDRAALIACTDSRRLDDLGFELADLVITDPPYADNVNYAELADFFHVWLRLILKDRYAWFRPEYTPKIQEIVENKSRGTTADDFGRGLQEVFAKAKQKLKPDGLMAFTFHHAEDSAWVALLEAICKAGFVLEAIYPIQSEGSTSLHLQDKEAIAYDLIHVCRPRLPQTGRRSWAGLKAQVRRLAQEEIRQIETGRYGQSALPSPDVRMVLIGKCLEVYSQNYGAVVDWQGESLPLRAALQDIRLMVEQIASSEHPLPTELESTDAITQVWLLALCNQREITVDSLSKTTRGIFEVGDLTNHQPPLVHKKRAKGGRSWEILTPAERLNGLREILMKAPPTVEQLDLGIVGGERTVVIGPPLVDVLHLLLACAETGERLDPVISFFDAQRGPIRAALEWLKGRDPERWAKPCDLLLGFYSDVRLTSLLSPTEPKA